MPVASGPAIPPVNLGDAVNTSHRELDPFIAPDETYHLFAADRTANGLNDEDLYIAFRKEDGSWIKAQNMGPDIDSDQFDVSPYVSPDEKYLFFWSDRNGNHDIYWIDAQIIEQLKRSIL